MTIHRPVFGRKVTPSNASPAQAPANDPGGKRILPEELWEGDTGDMLRELGFHPGDPQNFAPTQESADALQDEQIALQSEFLERVNAQLPAGTSVAAYAMLPWELWNTQYGHMLAVNCGLWPQQAWNTMLLAADERSSYVLDLPEHPGGYPDGLIPQLESLLGELREDMDAQMDQIKTSQNLTWDGVQSWDHAAKAMIPKIIAMSHYVGQMCIGEAAFARHKQLFGATLGWPGCD
ncbi:hypothetical protein [Erythrobacter sp. JK5]|uniref:hypothetical protein n=1 Tax=Erythrobacter sp. JK5 TaxID=2829500 RepID=UPI001BA8F712|nr:hypothetical protein [Erythrobacter sp. JK5]QUL36457.1 hypothetical protein KDC96_08325 [Erythrobacter sp. JK5]